MKLNERFLYSRLGERLKARREDLGWSQARLADRVGVLRTSVANIEAGRQRPPLHVLYALCAEMGLEVAEALPTVQEVSWDEAEEVVVGGTVRRVPPRTAVLLRSVLGETSGGTA